MLHSSSFVARFLGAVVSFAAFAPSTCSPAATLKAMSDPSACKIPATDVYLSAGFGFPADLSCVSSIGTMKAFMLFIDFADQPSGNDTTDGLYDFFFPNASEWYQTSSYGRISIDAMADKSQFYRMPMNASEYGWTRGITYEQHQAYIQDALGAYTNTTGKNPPQVDVLYVVPARSATLITDSPTFMGNVTTRAGAFVAPKAVTIGYDAYARWGFKVINHETGHVMCLPDYYPATGAVGLYVGEFDIMGNINGMSPDYFAWDKWRLGWLDDSQIHCLVDANKTASTHMIYPLETKGTEMKSVVLKRNETQAMVLEARVGGGVDVKGEAPGVVVYTVDTTVETLQGPIKVLTSPPLNTENRTTLAVPDWGLEISVVGRKDDAYVVKISPQALV